MSWRRPLSAVWALAGVLAAGTAAGQEPPVAAGAAAAEGATVLGLAEAVALTLRNSPEVLSAATEAAERRGAWHEASGRFDLTLFGELDFVFRQEYLVRDELAPEISRRVPAEFAAIARPEGPPGALDYAASLLDAGRFELLVDECEHVATVYVIEVPEEDATVSLCLDLEGDVVGVAVDANGIPARELRRLVHVLGLLETLGADFEREAREQIARQLEETAALLRATAEALRIQRARLGPLPEEREQLDLRLESGLRRQYRNGVQVIASVSLVGTQDDYDGKPHDPDFGDTLSANTFTTAAGLRAVVPLGRGRGRIATAGPELAAEEAYRAQRELLLHTASERALETVRSYLRLAAATESLRLRTESVADRREIAGLTGELTEYGELPAAEANRADTRLQEALRDEAVARRELLDARLDLVREIGASVDRLGEAPMPATGLPASAAPEPAPAEWFEQALRHRHDLAAAAAASRAAALLEATAQADLRRPVDLLANVSYSGFDESFERRIYDLGGYWEAASGRIVGPSYGVALRFSWPFANRTARGRLLQASAARARSEITEGDLERVIRVRLADLAGTVAALRSQVESLAEARDRLAESLGASQELFRIGDLTLIDLLTTEEQLTRAGLDLVAAQRELAIAEAEVRFETGTLLRDPGGAGAEGDPGRLELAWLAAAPAAAGEG